MRPRDGRVWIDPVPAPPTYWRDWRFVVRVLVMRRRVMRRLRVIDFTDRRVATDLDRQAQGPRDPSFNSD